MTGSHCASPPSYFSTTTALAAGGTVMIWGMSGVYFYFLALVPPIDVLSHRIIWTLCVLAIVLWVRGRFGLVAELLRNRRTRLFLCFSGLAVSSNWGLYVWAVGNGQALECSLAYFISPILAVLLASVFLREKLLLRARVAIAVLGAGVAFRIVSDGGISWTPLVIAVSFSIYMLLRKTVAVDSTAGLFIETMLLFPFALLYTVYREVTGQGFLSFETGGYIPVMLVLSGPLMTALPLVLLNVASGRMRLTTLGLIQYINPLVQMAAAVVIIGEPLTLTMVINFVFVWIGLLIYSSNFFSFRKHRKDASS